MVARRSLECQPRQGALSHDNNGNLTADGLFRYTYDAWNRLVGVWYYDGDVADADERVAAYEYDGLFRRMQKVVTNQGSGIVNQSDAGGVTGIQAGNRTERYRYAGWRLVEVRDGAAQVLGQFVYGTQYIDEPVRYDRNTDIAEDDDCIDTDTGGSVSYYYHQDANYRVVMLTDEDGQVVERCEYSAYGEPLLHGGYSSTAGAELGNALLISAVGNPLLHQGLFYDREIGSYQNRYRQHVAPIGRFMQRDPLSYDAGLSLYGYLASSPTRFHDPFGLICEAYEGAARNSCMSGFSYGAGGTARSSDDCRNACAGSKHSPACEDGCRQALVMKKPPPPPPPRKKPPGPSTPTSELAGELLGPVVGGACALYGAACIDDDIDAGVEFGADQMRLTQRWFTELEVGINPNTGEDLLPKPDSNGRSKPFQLGECGTCAYQCVCSPDGQSRARLICEGGKMKCSGATVRFNDPRNNPCTNYCRCQAKKGTK